MSHRYVVTYAPDTILRKVGAIEIVVVKHKAHEAQARRELIEADYFKLEGGHLIFRCYADRQSDGYPRTIKVFAPGVWSEVEEELC